jgi:hypothetical protein
MAHEFRSVKLLPGYEVRYTQDYLYLQYGKSANQKELYYLKGVVIGLKQLGLSSQSYANVAWENGLTYQVPVDYLEPTHVSKTKVPA